MNPSMPVEQVTAPQAQPQQPQSLPWYENLAPTIGAVGGGVIGSVLGGIPGGIAGAGIGGGIGQGVKNAGEKQNPIQMNDLTTGLTSAVGQGLGDAALGGAGALLGKVGGGVAQQGADAGVRALLKQQLAAHSLPSGIDPEQVAETLMNNGVTDLRKVPQLFGQLTGKENTEEGGGGLLTQGVDYLVKRMEDKGITIRGGYHDQMGLEALNDVKTPVGVTATTRNEINNNINDQLINAGILKKASYGGTAKTKVPIIANDQGGAPTAVRQAIRNLREAARNQDYTKPEGKAAIMAYTKVANQLSDDVLKHPYAIVTPQMKIDMVDSLSGLARKNPQLYNNMKNTITNAHFAQDLNDAQQPLVDAIRAAESPVYKGASVNPGKLAKAAIAPTVGLASGGPLGALAGEGLDALTMTPGGQAMMAGTLSKAPGVLGGLGGALTSPAAIATGGGLGAGALSLGASPPVPDNQSLTAGGGSAMPQGDTGGVDLSNTSPSDILGQIDRAFIANPDAASGMLPVLQALTQKVAAATAAKNALDQYQQTLQQAGGPAGPLGGLLEGIGGAITGGPASRLGAEQKAAQAALQTAGAGSVQLPGLMSNQAGAQAGIGQAQSILSALGAQ